MGLRDLLDHHLCMISPPLRKPYTIAALPPHFLDMNHQSMPLGRYQLCSLRVKGLIPCVVPVCLERWCLSQRQRAFCGRTRLYWSPLPRHQAALSASRGSESHVPSHHQSTFKKGIDLSVSLALFVLSSHVTIINVKLSCSSRIICEIVIAFR